MVFSSVLFLFLFLPAVFFAYFLIPQKYRTLRNLVLLLFSLAFYYYGEPKLITIMLLSILINYISGVAISYSKKKALKKLFLIFAVVINIGLLGYYKYFNFFAENFASLFGISINVAKVILPIGISFYTFQGLSYVIDVYRNNAPIQKNPINIALYISLFPQLIAGPIVRYNTVAEEINVRKETASDFAEGIKRFMFGFSKKMLLANTMGAVADEIFALDVSSLNFDLAWLGAISYEFQIFFDFSGYSDMAIGLGLMFGFHFLENFNFPLISKSVTEFWRRWHISLGTWFRDYVYIPLGGNRVSPSRHILNIFVVWTLTGFWHGANWTFMAWGIYFGILLILEKFFILKILNNIPKVFSHIYTLILVTVSWVIFRSDNISSALIYISKMFTINGNITDRFLYLFSQHKIELVLCIIASIPISRYIKEKAKMLKNEKLKTFLLLYPVGLFAALIFAISILYLINSTFNPFIYFRF